MYKNKNIIALIATIIWLSFIFAAFKGFYFWYEGFVFFFWICLGILNYRHETSIWLLKNRPHRFLKYFLFLFVLGFFADYVVGQKLTSLWIYPLYNSYDDWARLYLIIYPIGGLTVLELIYFLGGVFKEKFALIHKPVSTPDRLEIIIDGLLLLTILIYLISKFVYPLPYLRLLLVMLLLAWTTVATLKFKYHIKHWSHWVAILFTTLFMSLFLHEIPNTAVYEWRYYPAPLFNQIILGIPLWVYFGWYFLILLMLRFWMYLVLAKQRR
jgi:hypothetical protein